MINQLQLLTKTRKYRTQKINNKVTKERKEEEWKEENEITGGYLAYCNQIIADTGENVRKAAIFKLPESLKPSNPKHSESQKQKQSGERRAIAKWPPNPCDPVNSSSVRITYSFVDYR